VALCLLKGSAVSCSLPFRLVALLSIRYSLACWGAAKGCWLLCRCCSIARVTRSPGEVVGSAAPHLIGPPPLPPGPAASGGAGGGAEPRGSPRPRPRLLHAHPRQPACGQPSHAAPRAAAGAASRLRVVRARDGGAAAAAAASCRRSALCGGGAGAAAAQRFSLCGGHGGGRRACGGGGA
jgi:hypothetical protein